VRTEFEGPRFVLLGRKPEGSGHYFGCMRPLGDPEATRSVLLIRAQPQRKSHTELTRRRLAHGAGNRSSGSTNTFRSAES